MPPTQEEINKMLAQMGAPTATDNFNATEMPSELADLGFVDRTKQSKVGSDTVLESMEGVGYGAWAVMGRLNDCVIGKHKPSLRLSGDDIEVNCSLCGARLAMIKSSQVSYQNPEVASAIVNAKNRQMNVIQSNYRNLISRGYMTQRAKDKIVNYVANLVRAGKTADAASIKSSLGLTEKGWNQFVELKDLPISPSDKNNDKIKGASAKSGGWFTLTK